MGLYFKATLSFCNCQMYKKSPMTKRSLEAKEVTAASR